MKRILFKIIIPAALIIFWCWFSVCVCRTNGWDWFALWIMIGFPFGIRKMLMVLVPVRFGIAGTVDVFALDCIVAGLIGGVVMVWTVGKIIRNRLYRWIEEMDCF